jgi:plasmid stabilization system protein ParE
VNRARFTQQARIELLAQTRYYETVRAGLGARFRSEVEAAAQRAAAFPLHGKPSVGGTRRRLVASFPFTLFYTAEEYGVLVHAVASHRQPPDYWVGRLQGDG